MTFGEHLEELRWALLKALAALTIGVIIGFFWSYELVDYIQTPLRNALREHYGEVAKKDYRRYLESRREEGLPIPGDLAAATDEFAKQGLVMEERYVDPRQLAENLAAKYPSLAEQLMVVAPPKNQAEDGAVIRRNDLMVLRLYHDLDRDSRIKLVGLGSQEPFLVYMKASLVLGAVLASPFVFYFIWQFVAAGLFPHEKRYIHIFLPFSIALFLAGAALAFFFAFTYVLRFLLWFYEIMNIDPELRISDWLSFVLMMPIGFGISFQLPLVMLFLERIGIFSISAYLSYWRMAVLVICFIAMVLTPAEPNSMLLMAIPLVFLYFGGILLCKLMPRRTTPFGDTID